MHACWCLHGQECLGCSTAQAVLQVVTATPAPMEVACLARESFGCLRTCVRAPMTRCYGLPRMCAAQSYLPGCASLCACAPGQRGCSPSVAVSCLERPLVIGSDTCRHHCNSTLVSRATPAAAASSVACRTRKSQRRALCMAYERTMLVGCVQSFTMLSIFRPACAESILYVHCLN
jgi:hypothetical protein